MESAEAEKRQTMIGFAKMEDEGETEFELRIQEALANRKMHHGGVRLNEEYQGEV